MFAHVFKFNQNHDPHSGEFSSGDGSQSSSDAVGVYDDASILPGIEKHAAGVKLDVGVSDALEWYTSSGYAGVNSYLRSGVDKGSGAKETADVLSNFLSKQSFPRSIIAYRGISTYREVLGNLKPGDVFTDKGITSTSLAMAKAEAFKGNSHTLFRITVPKGAHAFYTAAYSNVSTEKELLLAPGSKFLVKKIHFEKSTINPEDGPSDIRVIDVDLIQDPVKKFNQHHDEKGKFTFGDGSGGTFDGVTNNREFVARAKQLYKDQGVDDWNKHPATLAGLKGAYFGTSNSFRINGFLRTGKLPYGSLSQAQADIATMDGSFENVGVNLDAGTKLYRAVGDEFAKAMDGMKIGSSFEDKGFVSTTPNIGNTRQFGKNVLKIVLQNGTKAVLFNMEDEVLLPRGRTFTLVKKTKKKGGLEFEVSVT